MTDIELIKAIKANYQKEFKENPTTSEKVNAFRRGIIYAYDYLIVILKEGYYGFMKGDK